MLCVPAVFVALNDKTLLLWSRRATRWRLPSWLQTPSGVPISPLLLAAGDGSLCCFPQLSLARISRLLLLGDRNNCCLLSRSLDRLWIVSSCIQLSSSACRCCFSMIPATSSRSFPVFFVGQTMEMMYRIISQEIMNMKLDAHPQDYLNFYCLGNRELPKSSEQQNGDASEKDSANLSKKFRRFMIYVHAKGMIVDDEYIIVGSANINQRSLAGSRDTEIAMGAYQPHHTWAEKNRHPHGQIYGYRMSLWSEHTGMLDGLFETPGSVDCIRLVNEIADENWANFTADEMKSLKGHLLRYPVKVELDGKVVPIPGQEIFPDVGGKILGAPTSLPDSLTM